MPDFLHPGVVTIAQTLDYEVSKSILVTVVAQDGGSPPLSASCLLNITLQDINDNAPEFSETAYEASVKENAEPGTVVSRVSNAALGTASVRF